MFFMLQLVDIKHNSELIARLSLLKGSQDFNIIKDVILRSRL